MELLITEYRKLAQKRNQCIHWVWPNVSEGKALVRPPAYKMRQSTVEHTIESLRLLADDLSWLHVRLMCHMATDENLRWIRAERPDKAHFAPAPWLDKQEPPNPKPSKTCTT